MSKRKKLQLLEVTWEDAYNNASWCTTRESKDFHKSGMECKTVGYASSQDRRGITLAQTMNGCDQRGALWFIPHGVVKKVRKLK